MTWMPVDLVLALRRARRMPEAGKVESAFFSRRFGAGITASIPEQRALQHRYLVTYFDQCGSYTPAPGHRMSTSPNSSRATSNIFDNSGQDVTSVFTKTARAARALLPGSLCFVMSSSASGRRPRSAITTLQSRDSSSAAKERLMPFCSISVNV